MEWLVAIADSSVRSLPWLFGLAAGFGVLARLMPCNRGMFWGKDLRAAATDLLYWFVMPLFVSVAKTWVLAGALALLVSGGSRTIGFAALRELPIWLQCILVLWFQDVMLYWIHRVFHRPVAWPFHAVHHSPKVLDWASATRNHFVNHLFSYVLVDVVTLLHGFDARALIWLAPFNVIYACMVHANLNWTFGPLRYVFASPVFHRWHHVAEGEAIDKNFASTFPILDVVFGTFYMPLDLVPEQFGNGDPEYPEDFVGQMIHPFVPKGKPAVAAEPVAPKKAA